MVIGSTKKTTGTARVRRTPFLQRSHRATLAPYGFVAAPLGRRLRGHDDPPLQPLGGELVLDVQAAPAFEVLALVVDGLAVGDHDPGHDVTPRRTMTAEGLSGAAS
jgi:hypothetical protein